MDKNEIEIERKYIIEMPDVSALRQFEGFGESEITQIYLAAPEGVTRRVRRRVRGDVAEFTQTEKVRIDKMSVIERESEIGENEYLSLAEGIADGTRPIIKRRITFVYSDQLFEIDIYPQWTKTAIMETELESRESRAAMPDLIRIIREVTGEREYSNAAMSKKFPKEDI